MTGALSPSARRIQEALSAAVSAASAEAGAALQVVELPQSTRTAAQAAAAIGCSVAQIAKSIVFRTAAGKVPLLVIARGTNRIDEARVAALMGEPIEKADADYVREATGFAIGGIPPLGHAQPMRTFIDEDLLALGDIWAAAGTPNAVFKLQSKVLAAMTGGTLARVRQE